MISYADLTLMLVAGSLLVTFLAGLIVLNLWRLREDTRRWQETRTELHRMQTEQLEEFRARLDGIEDRVDRIIPVARIEVTGGREVLEHHDAEGI